MTSPPDPETAPRPKIKELEVIVAQVVRESPEASTLVLFTGNDRLEYLPGHFVTVAPHQFPALERFIAYFEEAKGRKEPARAYSLSSAPHERSLAVTIKEERYVSGVTRYPPLLSPHLVWDITPGTRMVVTGFSGPYTLPADIESRTDHLVHLCAGSGIVPNMSMIKEALHRGLRLRHTLIYANRTWKDAIFRKQLDALARAHPGRLRIVHALSRDQAQPRSHSEVRQGRVNEALLREFIPDPSAAEVYLCGPGLTKHDRAAAREKGVEPAPRFLESAMTHLAAVGVPAERINRESYG
jgi:3-ketosteroid 9alpha-monooxygenase subunit B